MLPCTSLCGEEFRKGEKNAMDAAERRKLIQDLLEKSEKPVSAGLLAKRLRVSRQAIVGDVALLRAGGSLIAATPRGYVMQRKQFRPGDTLHTIACRHTAAGIADELYTVVDNGCGILDVTVEHAVYGQISGQLQIFSRLDADDFLRKLSRSGSQPLCSLTGGVHLHTISCPSEEAYRRVLSQLKAKKILYQKGSDSGP